MVLLDCLPLTGPVVVVKRKGTCYCTRTRGVSTSTETLPYIAPVPTLPIGQTCSHSHPVGDQEHISFLYGSTTLTLALPKIPRSIDKAYSKPHTAPSYCTIVLHHRLPAFRTIIHPCLVSSGVNPLTCIALSLSQLPCRAGLHFRVTAAAAIRPP